MKKIKTLIIFSTVFFGMLATQVLYSMSKSSDVKSLSDVGVKLSQSKIEKYEAEFQKLNINSKSPIVLVNFWASWCRPCMDELPSLLKLKKKIGADSISIVAINEDDDEQKKNVDKVFKKFNITNEIDVVLDNNSISNKFDVTAIPVSILFKKGKLITYINGPQNFSESNFLTLLNQLIKKD